MAFDYQEFLDRVDRKAYHEGEFQWQEGDYTVTRTYQYSPPGCHDSCGVLFYTKDCKLEKVEGDPLDPVANGKLCMRCLNLAEAVNHPDRVKYPMKRAGKRGENKWERISWDEAYDIIVEKVNYFKENFGPESIINVHGTGRNINWQSPYFGNAALQTPNTSTFGFSAFSCYMPRICGSIAPLGDFPIADASEAHADRYNNPEWKAPEVIVVWGNEPLASNADGYLGHWLAVCVQMGSKIISIDPRLTWWGARSEYWLQLRPGTDAAIACAWINTIITEDLYDHHFVDYWCAGFEELAESVKDCTPEWAAEISGVDADVILGSARLYASGNNSAIQWGLAFDQQLSTMSLCLASCELMAITGNLDVPGGNILVRNAFEINAGYATGEEFVPPESMANRLFASVTWEPNSANIVAAADSDALTYALEKDKPYPLKMMWIQSSNTLSCPGMDAPRLYKAMQKLEFVVNCDPFITPTSVAFADILLPVAMSPERNSARTWWTPVRTMSKVTQYYEAKSDEEIMVELGHRLNPKAFSWKTDVEMLNWYLHDGTGSFSASADVAKEGGSAFTGSTLLKKDFHEIEQQGGHEFWDWDATYKKYEKGLLRSDGQVGFQTPSGRVELAPLTYKMWNLRPTPFHEEPPEGPISTPELMKEYPLIVTTGGRSFEFFHSEHRQLPTSREFHPQPLVTINPKTAAEYGIKDGDWVWVENEGARYKQKAKLFAGIAPGVIHAEHAWWFPETEGAEPNLFGTFDSNPNNLTRPFVAGQGGIGSPIKSGICKIYKYEEGDVESSEQVVENGGFGRTYTPGAAYATGSYDKDFYPRHKQNGEKTS